MEGLQFPVEIVLTDGNTIKLPPIKVKQERQIFKIVGNLLSVLPDEAVALVSGMFGATDTKMPDVSTQDMLRLIQLLLTELPDQALEVASILAGMEMEEAEETLCYADVAQLIIMFITMSSERFSFALSVEKPQDPQIGEVPNVADHESAAGSGS